MADDSCARQGSEGSGEVSARKQHLAEMRYALAHNCSLAEAKRALAALRLRAADELQRERENRPVISGRELERRRRTAPILNRGLNGIEARWMMRD